MTNRGSKPHNGLQQVEGYKPTESLPNAKPGHATQSTQPREQLELEFYAGPPDPAGHTWHAFTLATPEEEAAAVFLRRYGRQPEFVFDSHNLLLCGPVPGEVL